MSKHAPVIVPEFVWAEMREHDQTPPMILGNMDPWVSQYAFPYWQTPDEERCLKLERRGRIGEDRWALLDGGHCYNKRTGIWEYERSPSNRSDRFLEDCRLTIAEARPVIVSACWYLHQHAFRRTARQVTIYYERQARQKDLKTQRQLLATALRAYHSSRVQNIVNQAQEAARAAENAQEGT